MKQSYRILEYTVFFSGQVKGKMRKHCGMWHDTPSIKWILQSSITDSQGKMRL